MGIISFIKSDKHIRKEKWEKFIARKKYAYNTNPSLLTRIKTEFFLLMHKQESIVIDGWLVRFYKRTNDCTGNWGDDINVWLIEVMTGKKVIPAKMLFFSSIRKKYCVIGTVIPSFVNNKTLIWGSGYGLENVNMKRKPAKVLAVRGPMTRQYLLSQSVDCPAIFGDPALLLPKYYQPHVTTKKNKIGVVLHHRDWDVMGCAELARLQSEALVIDLTRYERWTDVIDEICSCDLILSSSLHGLIVSDAYGIPNLFMEFCWKHGSHFKYQDYFSSVGKPWVEPLCFENRFDFDFLMSQAMEQMKHVVIDTEMLELSCPFTLKQ